jgi:hypothetical protein
VFRAFVAAAVVYAAADRLPVELPELTAEAAR